MSFNTAIANQYKKFLQQKAVKVEEMVAACNLHDVICSIDCFMESVRQVLNVPFSKLQNYSSIIPIVDRDAIFGKIKEMLKLANTFDSDINEIINFYDPTYLEFVLGLTEKAEDVKEVSEIFGLDAHKQRRRRADLITTLLPYKGTRTSEQSKQRPTDEEVDEFLQTVTHVCNLIDQKLTRVSSFPGIDIMIGESNEFVTHARVFRANGLILVSYYNDALLPLDTISRSFVLKDELTKNKHSILLNDPGALDRYLDMLCKTAVGFSVQTLRNLMSDCSSTVLDAVDSIAGEYIPDFIHTQGDFYPASTEEGRKEFLQAKAKEIHFALPLKTDIYIDGTWKFTSTALASMRQYGFGFDISQPISVTEAFLNYDTLEVTLSHDVFKFNADVSFSIKLRITEKDIGVWILTQMSATEDGKVKRKVTSLKNALAFAKLIQLMPLYLEALMVDGYLLDSTEFLRYPHHIVHRSVQVIKESTQGNK